MRSPFSLMDAKCSSLQLYITPVIVSIWPLNRLMHLFLCRSHILTICPLPPEQRYLELLLLKLIQFMDSYKIEKSKKIFKMFDILCTHNYTDKKCFYYLNPWPYCHLGPVRHQSESVSLLKKYRYSHPDCEYALICP